MHPVEERGEQEGGSPGLPLARGWKEREERRERVVCTYDVRGHPAIDSRE